MTTAHGYRPNTTTRSCSGIVAQKNTYEYDPLNAEQQPVCGVNQLKEIPYRQPSAEVWVLSKINALNCGRYAAGPDYHPF